ncbi:MAG: hypothetical protein AAF490_04450 [Chloroflexota bacterium]
MNPDSVVNHILSSGIVATLPSVVPLQDITKLSDALLASPVLTVQMPWCMDAASLICDLKNNGNGNMVVGVSGVTTAVSLRAAISAGAQFIITPQYDPELAAICKQYYILMIPTVISGMVAAVAYQNGLKLINMRTGGHRGPDFISMVQRSIPGLHVAVGGNFSQREIAVYAQFGASAIIVQDAIYEGGEQLMADVITNARRAQKGWDKGLKNRQRFGSERPFFPSLN